MTNWRQATLGDLITLQRGFDLPEPDRQVGSIPVIASTGIVGFHSKAMVKAPGVVIGRSGSVGGGQFIKKDFWPLNTTLWVKDFKGNDERFCYYLLRSIDFSGFNAGSGVPTLNRNHIHPLPIRYPSPPEQSAIADVLSSLDDKIELNRRMNATLESLAQTLFEHWFIDNPEREGWNEIPINDIASITTGLRPEAREKEKSKNFSIPLFGGGGIMAYTKQPLFTIPILLTGRVGTLGIIFRIPYACWASDNTLVFTPRKSHYFEYLYFCLQKIDFSSLNRGSTQPLVTQSDLQKEKIVIPPEKILIEFHEIIAPIFDLQDSNNMQNENLTQLLDTLLPKLMSGQVRVTPSVIASGANCEAIPNRS